MTHILTEAAWWLFSAVVLGPVWLNLIAAATFGWLVGVAIRHLV